MNIPKHSMFFGEPVKDDFNKTDFVITLHGITCYKTTRKTPIPRHPNALVICTLDACTGYIKMRKETGYLYVYVKLLCNTKRYIKEMELSSKAVTLVN